MVIGFFLIFSLSTAFAQDAVVCPSKDFKEFVRCLVAEHPEMRRALYLEQRAEGERSDGRRFLNPEIEYESVKGKFLGDTRATNRTAVSYPLEIFGQRGARVNLGDATADLTRTEKVKTQNEVFMEIVLKLYRYRQILEEVEVIEEGLSAYSKVVNMLAGRPKLTPEHQVSLSVFKLAEGDFRFKKTNLVSEKRAVEDFFSHVRGLQITKLKNLLPVKKQIWPEVRSVGTIEDSAYYKAFDYQVDKAKALNESAKSKTWPTLRAAAIAETNVEGSTDYNSFGFGVSAEIPFLNWNGGERQATKAEKMRAELEAEIGKKEVINERSRLFEFYNNSKRELSISPKRNDVEQKHRNVDSLYYRGLIPSSLLVEAHRQILDFTTSQNEIEYKALEALMKIYALDGKLNEEFL